MGPCLVRWCASAVAGWHWCGWLICIYGPETLSRNLPIRRLGTHLHTIICLLFGVRTDRAWVPTPTGVQWLSTSSWRPLLLRLFFSQFKSDDRIKFEIIFILLFITYFKNYGRFFQLLKQKKTKNRWLQAASKVYYIFFKRRFCQFLNGLENLEWSSI